MDTQTPTVAGNTLPDFQLFEALKISANNMTLWLKLLGIINIIQGAFIALSIIGILVAWIPIWLGVLLFQAGNRAQNAVIANNPRELVVMMDKLRLYFIIQGIIFVVILAFVLIGFIIMGGALFSIFSQFNPGDF